MTVVAFYLSWTSPRNVFIINNILTIGEPHRYLNKADQTLLAPRSNAQRALKIRTNCVNPTATMTDMGKYAWSDPEKSQPLLDRIPLGRFAEVDDVVNAVLWLLSDKASYINGVTLPVEVFVLMYNSFMRYYSVRVLENYVSVMGCSRFVGTALFRTGQLLLLLGAICYVVSLSTTSWVVRPDIDPIKNNVNLTQTKVVKNFGIFRACRQTSGGESNVDCGDITDNIPSISAHAAKYVQFAMVMAGILFAASLILEILQVIPMKKYPNFIAENRIVEMFSSVAIVWILQGILIFAGEVKNKAERVNGQQDERAGWSFVVALIGLIVSVFGLLLITMFRQLPFPGPGLKGGSWLNKSMLNDSQSSQE
ncbi:hypothetical protein Btru_035517 [Bulinus truncatus]|nr:hypothetical protein Btru_035517 [Bulinus truncatus]